ncbi:MAG: hypothetical protein KDA61_14430 [Planctomycetales bacterium]|nr:hypothetical protein [Planctomycetales bacterium]
MTSHALRNDEIAPSPTERRPRLLVSVRNADEVHEALSGGAEWIDLKEPSSGPLGSVSPETAQAAAKETPFQIPLSAAIGELLDWPVPDACQLLAINRLAWLKAGLAGCVHCTDWQTRWRRMRDVLALRGKQLVMAAYVDAERAEAPPWRDAAEFAVAEGCRYLLLDTFAKPRRHVPQSQPASPQDRQPVEFASIATVRRAASENRSLWDYVSDDELRRLAGSLEPQGTRLVVAGNLTQADMARVPRQAAMIAVRGAACCNGREGVVDAGQVEKLRRELERCFGRDSGEGGPFLDTVDESSILGRSGTTCPRPGEAGNARCGDA